MNHDPMACPVLPKNELADRIEALIAEIAEGRVRGTGMCAAKVVLHRLAAAMRRGEQAEFAREVCAVPGIPGQDLRVQ